LFFFYKIFAFIPKFTYYLIMAKKNQANISYDIIREKLLANEFKPGQRLKESFWAEELGVNRADVRQALARMLGEGLLVSGSKGGYFVRDYTEAEINEIYESRATLEIAAAKLAIERATEQDIQNLREICDQMQLLAENEYVLGIYEADLRFHSAMIRATHNKKLEKIYYSAHLPLTVTRNTTVNFKQNMLKDAAEHAAILDALIRKDIKAMTFLLTKSLTKILEQ
jgi:DNA-binding GntR family transcriptional regulator